MSIHFDQPMWLWLLALVVPMAVVGIVWFGPMSRLRRGVCVLARAMLIGTIAAMLAGATAVRRTESLTTLVILDRSGSVDAYFDAGVDASGARVRPIVAMRAAVRRAAKASDRRPDDRVGVVLLGEHAAALAAPTRGDALAGNVDAPVATGSDIASAIRLARAMAPVDSTGRIVLVSDGNQTSGDAIAEARLSGLSGMPIDVVPLRYAVGSEVMIETMDAPSVAPAKAPVVIRVTLRSTGNVTGTLELLDNGVSVDASPTEPGTGRRVRLNAGRSVELIELDLPPGRVHKFEAVFTPDDAADDRVSANNRGEAVTFSTAAGIVLLVDGVGGGDQSGPSATLRDALEASGLEVRLVSPDAAPRDLLELEAFDLVMLANVAAESLRADSVDALARYVTELAGGLVMIGGPESFGAGGWRDTPVAPLLPVLLDVPEKLVKPSAAVMLVLDTSGSMNDIVIGTRYTQQEIANEGAALAIESMEPTDMVGVITFSEWYRVRVPLDRNRDRKASANIVRRIGADGATNCGPALIEAGRLLENGAGEAQVRHIVVLSDGRSKNAEQLPDIAADLAAKGIKVSTIAVGTEADSETMSQMAYSGGGRFYRVIDAAVLPRVLVKAVRVVRSPLIREGDFDPVVLATGSPLVQGLPTGMPALGGLVLTQARTEPTVVFSLATPGGEPLLAHWNAGLGRVAAFTSDAHDWASRWVDWPGYGQMWTRIARIISRPSMDRRQELAMTLDGDLLRLRLDASDQDGKPVDLMSVPGAVYGPGGERTEVRLTQTGPGRYEAAVAAEEGGTYIATLAPRAGERPLAPVVGGISRAAGHEFAQLRSHEGLLETVARESGGRVIEFGDLEAANLFDRTSVRPSEARLPLWPMLLIWSVVLLLTDIGSRRIAWDRLLSTEFGVSLQREARAVLKGRGVEAAATAERLRRIEPARGNSATRPADGELNTEDAVAIVREQAQRRRQARSQTAEAAAPAPPTSREDVKRQREPSHGPTEEDSGGLLAAKRRAQKRIEEQREDRA